MKLQQTANDGKGKIILTFEGDDAQIEVCLNVHEAERLVDVVEAEVQDMLRSRRSNIGLGLVDYGPNEV